MLNLIQINNNEIPCGKCANVWVFHVYSVVIVWYSNTVFPQEGIYIFNSKFGDGIMFSVKCCKYWLHFFYDVLEIFDLRSLNNEI